MRRIIVFLILVSLAGAVYYRSLSLSDADEKAFPGKGSGGRNGSLKIKSSIPVATTVLTTGPIEDRINLTGEISPWQTARIMPRVAGFLNELTVREGKEVKAGKTLLATIDPSDYLLEKKSAQASLEVATVSANAKKLAFIEAERKLNREKNLFADKVSSQASLDDAIYQYNAAQADYNLANAQIRKSRSQLELAELKIGRCMIYSPIDGVISKRFSEGNEQVSPGASIMTIVDVEKLKVTGEITETDYWKILPAYSKNKVLPATITGSSGDITRTLTGTVRTIAPMFNKSSRTAVVEIDIKNNDKTLLPGMYVQVSILLRKVDKALLLPLDAFCERDSGNGVFLVKGETVSFIKPQLGIRSGRFIEVLSELNEGDSLVTIGNHLITDGSRIRVITR